MTSIDRDIKDTGNLDFSKRYWVGHGTTIYYTFDTAEELNEWHDRQDTKGRYFCRLYDTVKHISVLGSAYMFFNDSKRWKDEPQTQEKHPSVLEKLKQPKQEHKKIPPKEGGKV